MEVPRYSIGIAATRNENQTIGRTISTLVTDVLQYPLSNKTETLLCLNNYDSDTVRAAERIRESYPILDIRITDSQKGLIHAQRKIISEAKSESDFILFYDSDILIRSGSTRNLIDFMERNPKVHAASSDQIAHRMNSFWYQVYNFIGLNPQIMTPRRYINGRAFAIRKRSYFVPDNVDTEDTFLSHKLIYEYGSFSVQTVPEVMVEYLGPKTLADYYQKVRRLDLVKDKIYSSFPEFSEIAHLLKKNRVEDEIKRLSTRERFQLLLHDLILKTSKKLARTSKSPLWVALTSTKDPDFFKS